MGSAQTIPKCIACNSSCKRECEAASNTTCVENLSSACEVDELNDDLVYRLGKPRAFAWQEANVSVAILHSSYKGQPIFAMGKTAESQTDSPTNGQRAPTKEIKETSFEMSVASLEPSVGGKQPEPQTSPARELNVSKGCHDLTDSTEEAKRATPSDTLTARPTETALSPEKFKVTPSIPLTQRGKRFVAQEKPIDFELSQTLLSNATGSPEGKRIAAPLTHHSGERDPCWDVNWVLALLDAEEPSQNGAAGQHVLDQQHVVEQIHVVDQHSQVPKLLAAQEEIGARGSAALEKPAAHAPSVAKVGNTIEPDQRSATPSKEVIGVVQNGSLGGFGKRARSQAPPGAMIEKKSVLERASAKPNAERHVPTRGAAASESASKISTHASDCHAKGVNQRDIREGDGASATEKHDHEIVGVNVRSAARVGASQVKGRGRGNGSGLGGGRGTGAVLERKIALKQPMTTRTMIIGFQLPDGSLQCVTFTKPPPLGMDFAMFSPVFVKEVKVNSHAYELGVRENWRVISVNGADMTGLKAKDVFAQLSSASKALL